MKALKAGTYSIAVRDRSPIHDFHLKGAGASRATTVRSTGSATWTVKLTKGVLTFYCDAHAAAMRGTVRVS